jgi:ABC-type antimicrobial peptide transport system permease subunit
MTYRYVVKELRNHHHRTLVNILGIAIGIALFVSINAVSAAYQKAVSLPFKNIGADLIVQKPEKRDVDSAQAPTSMKGIRLPFSNGLLTPEEIRKVSSLKDVSDSASSLLLWEFAEGGFRTIMGVDLSQPGLGPVKVKEWLAEGRFPQHEGEVILEKHYAKFHHARPGDTMPIGNRSFTVVGLLAIKEGAQVAAANIYLPINDARRLLGSDRSAVNVVYLRLKDPSYQEQVKKQIGNEFPVMSVASSDSFLEMMGGVSRISSRFALLTSLIALMGAISLIIKTMLSNLIARSHEIGILKAIGWTGRDINKQLMGEALLQSLAGGLLGITIGYAVSYGMGFLTIPASTPWQVNLMPAFAKEVQGAAASSVRLPVSVSVEMIFVALAVSVITGILASLLMARRTAGIKPLEILRKL